MKRRLMHGVLLVLVFSLFVQALFAQEIFGEHGESSQYKALPLPDWYARDIGRKVGIPVQDSHLSSTTAATWRTGVIDPAVEKLDASLLARLKADPARYIDELVRILADGAENDYHKVKRFHDWIGLHIAYNSDAFCGRSKGNNKAPDLIANSMATCGGFANLFKLMCDKVGIECLYIPGYSRSSVLSYSLGEKARSSDHAWNAVKLDGIWHIVDATSANRRGFEFGKFGELSSYRDGGMFMSPQAKLYGNLAYDVTKQLVDEPMSKETYYSLPAVSTQLFAEGVVLDFSGLSGRFEKIGMAREQADIVYVKDAWFPDGGSGSIRATMPANVIIKASLKNLMQNTSVPDAVLVEYVQATEAWVQASGPGRIGAIIHVTPAQSGAYQLSLYAARPLVGQGYSSRTIYTCQLFQYLSGDRASAWEPDRLYAQYAERLYGLSGTVSGERLQGLATDPAWSYVDVFQTDGYDYYASLNDEQVKSVAGGIVVSQTSAASRRYYIRSPADRWSFLTIYARLQGEKNYLHPVVFAAPQAGKPVFESVPAGLAQPLGVPIIAPLMAQQGFTYHGDLAAELPGTWSFTVAGNIRNTLRAYVKTLDNKDILLASQILATDRPGVALVRFQLSAGTAESADPLQLKLYQRDPKGNLSTLMSIVLSPEKAAAAALWEPGKLYEHVDVPKGSVQLVTLAPDGERAVFALSTDDRYESYFNLYDSEGKQVTGDKLSALYTYSYPEPGKKLVLFNPLAPEVLRMLVFARQQGEKDYGYAWSAAVPPLSVKPTMPALTVSALSKDQYSFRPVCAALFTTHKLKLIDHVVTPDAARIRFEGPQSLSASVSLRTLDGKTAAGSATLSYEKGLWTADFSLPAGVPAAQKAIYAKVYYKEGNRSSTLVTLFLKNQ